MAKSKSPTRGWDKQKPKTVTERRQMPISCFMDPKRRKYPVCPKGTRGSFKPSCKGAAAAFSRARQQHNQVVAKRAILLADGMGCSWVRTGKAAQKVAKSLGLEGCGCDG